jgi:carbamoyltransferase
VTVVLGINAFHAGASAALVVDGVPRIAVAEERLNRVKYYAGFPAQAISTCLREAGLRFEDIDVVAIGREPAANRGKKIEYVLRNPTKLLNLLKIKGAREGLDDVRALMARECGVDANALRFVEQRVEHHLAHIASAYFASGWDSAAGISIDGSGDFVCVMMAECEQDDIRVKHRIYVPHSLGSLYTMVCEFIGYDKYGDEGKVMGLAPLGRNTYKDVFDDMVRLTDDGIELTPKYFVPFGADQGMIINERGEMTFQRHYSPLMCELFGEPRKRHSEITQRDMDLAFGVQYIFERAYMHLLNRLHTLVPNERVVMAGGCALNSVANGKLFQETPFRRTWIQPAAGDDGLALGAALYVSRGRGERGDGWRMTHARLGPQFEETRVRAALDTVGVTHEQLERSELIRRTVDLLERGNVVGWFQGRMEWGPRALGARSILTHPGFPGMKDILNARIKRREWFRPFAPAVLADRQAEIFEHDHPSPFMLHVYNIRPEWRERLSAVTHVDNTGRLQTVSREEDELYYDLIQAFGERTGVPVLLNTSFNENEPIVNTPEEAIDCFRRTKMDALVIGPFVCCKTVEVESDRKGDTWLVNAPSAIGAVNKTELQAPLP